MSDTEDYNAESEDYAIRGGETPITGEDILGDEGALVMAIPAVRYPAGKTATARDADLTAGNIKYGVNVFGVEGSFSEPGWLFGWAKRIKLTIDHAQIAERLSHFPVTVFLSSTHGASVFSELQSNANRFKIAFTESNGVYPLYGEIELFDYANSKAIYHISRSNWEISNNTNTEIFLYYDSAHADNTTHIGDIASDPAANVWDYKFKAVHHMVDTTTSTVEDSTDNNSDGTKYAANEPIQASGKNGFAQSFDGSNYIELAYNPAQITNGTIECVFLGTGLKFATMVAQDASGYNDLDTLIGIGRQNVAPATDGHLVFETHFTGVPSNNNIESTGAVNDGAWHYGSIVVEGTTYTLYLDGVQNVQESGKIKAGLFNGLKNVLLGQRHYGYGGFVGKLDEVRITENTRTAAWMNATYNSLWDTLLTYGAEETP